MSTKILVVSDDGVSTGYGRICMEVNRRLVRRGFEVQALSIAYDGLLPPNYDGQGLPYWVSGAAGRDWLTALQGVAGAFKPDIILVVQDAPYAEAVFNSPLDWSQYAFMIITPVDGVPIFPPWIDLFAQADSMMTISHFGVEAHRKQGIRSLPVIPGVDGNVFYRYTDAERLQLRQMMGIAPDAFVLMTAAQNQGRKAIPSMLKGFFEFAKDKPTARYVLDMEPISPAGWNIPMLCKQFGWDAGKLLFRADCLRHGLHSLTMRYNLADAHAVLAFREGYGLPLIEAMACGAVCIAQDYCSGTEVAGEGKGILIPSVPEAETIGTWGGAIDQVPSIKAFTQALENLHNYPEIKRKIANKGMAWARTQSWDIPTDVVQGEIERVMNRRNAPPPPPPPAPPPPPPPAFSAAPPPPIDPERVRERHAPTPFTGTETAERVTYTGSIPLEDAPDWVSRLTDQATTLNDDGTVGAKVEPGDILVFNKAGFLVPMFPADKPSVPYAVTDELPPHEAGKSMTLEEFNRLYWGTWGGAGIEDVGSAAYFAGLREAGLMPKIRGGDNDDE